jgi:hypothetical protein
MASTLNDSARATVVDDADLQELYNKVWASFMNDESPPVQASLVEPPSNNTSRYVGNDTNFTTVSSPISPSYSSGGSGA